MRVVDGKKGEPSKWNFVFAAIFTATFFGVGAGVLTFLGVERNYVRAKPYDLGHALATAVGTFALCFLIASVYLAFKFLRRHRHKS
jgi:hypothetical protein